MKDKKIKELKNLIDTAEITLQHARSILADISDDPDYAILSGKAKNLTEKVEDGEKIIEGVFDGQQMVGPDGKKYSIPVNYASKSKLIEGDVMKLTIKKDGTFLYKQIGPLTRVRVKGILMYDNESDDYRVMTEDGKSFKILTASVTYFKGEPGDQVVALIGKDTTPVWAALENIVRVNTDDTDSPVEAKEVVGSDNTVDKIGLEKLKTKKASTAKEEDVFAIDEDTEKEYKKMLKDDGDKLGITKDFISDNFLDDEEI